MIRRIKILWTLLKMVRLMWKREKLLIRLSTPRENHERQYIRAIQQMQYWSARFSEPFAKGQYKRVLSIAADEHLWLEQHGYPLPDIPKETVL